MTVFTSNSDTTPSSPASIDARSAASWFQNRVCVAVCLQPAGEFLVLVVPGGHDQP
jgi:hypothetical protein